MRRRIWQTVEISPAEPLLFEVTNIGLVDACNPKPMFHLSKAAALLPAINSLHAEISK